MLFTLNPPSFRLVCICQKIRFIKKLIHSLLEPIARRQQQQQQQRVIIAILIDQKRTNRMLAGFPVTEDHVLERSGLLGTRRGWANINRYEIIFLVMGVLAALATDILTIIRLFDIKNNRDPDLAYGILILVHSLFLLLFLITGIFYQRITDIVAFFLSAVLLTTYVIVHFITRLNSEDSQTTKDKAVRLARLIFTIAFNILFLPLAIYVIRDYRRDEFSKRVLGAFLADRLPLIIYNIFDCLARINTMLSISSLLLNLYNFNDFEPIDKILLSFGIPFTFIWLGLGIGMLRMEKYFLVGFFVLFSFFQPGFIIYSFYSAIENHSNNDASTITSTFPSTTQFFTLNTFEETSATIMTTIKSSTMTPINLIPVLNVLYVCLGLNFLTQISAVVVGCWCVKNFGKGLKDRIFNNRFDKWFQQLFP